MKVMPPLRFGCQTYTWQMSFEKYQDRLEEIISSIKASGMSGIEPEVCMLGKFTNQPEKLYECLESHGMALGALCLVCDWSHATESPEEKMQADAAIAMLRNYFPQSVLVLCQTPGTDRQNIAERQQNALKCINSVGARASAAGITSAFHPNSPAGSVFRTADDYAVLLEGMDSQYVGFAPDAGHIAKGGMDVIKMFQNSSALIRHVHFKDMDAKGNWIQMGQGCIDFPGIIEHLQGSEYQGWIMIEDESALAENDPDAATLENGRYLEEMLHKKGLVASNDDDARTRNDRRA
jgi:inosose dehydratase